MPKKHRATKLESKLREMLTLLQLHPELADDERIREDLRRFARMIDAVLHEDDSHSDGTGADV